MGPGIIFSLLIITVGLTLYSFLRARHIERMAMIEKGMLHHTESRRHFRWIPNFIGVKIGMLIFGAGLGMLIAYFICMATNDETIYPTMIMLFGGGSLVASFFVERQLAQRIEDRQERTYERKVEYQEEF